MGKVKAMMMDLEEQGLFDADEAYFDYQKILWEEENEPYQLSKEEEQAYNLYMEGKLCGEHKNTVHTDTSINLLNGQLESIRLRRKRSSKR